MTSGGHTPTSPIFQSVPCGKMAATLEMEALRLQNEELKAEVGRLKETRAAIYKLYLESQGTKQWIFTRAKVFEALQLSADPEKKEPAPKKVGFTADKTPTVTARERFEIRARPL